MKRLLPYIFLLLLVVPIYAGETFPVPKGESTPLSYVALQPCSEIIIDGRLDEESWLKADWTEDFVDIEGSSKPLPYLQTRAKILWSQEGLYIGAELEETDVWATLTQRDVVIFHDNDFEVFIDPDGDTHDYYELEINALNTVWDLLLIKPYRDRQQVAVNSWDIKGLQTAVYVDGHINNPKDIDHGWQIEMLIPWETLAECAHMPCPPSDTDYWRINFSRVQWQTTVQDGKYRKVPGVPEFNWVWSPQGLVAMHYPERWGYLHFSQAKAGDTYRKPSLPAKEAVKDYLRKLYYLQKQYYMDKGYYAKSLKQLGAKPYLVDGRKLPILFQHTSQTYLISIKPDLKLPSLHIREDGLIWEK